MSSPKASVVLTEPALGEQVGQVRRLLVDDAGRYVAGWPPGARPQSADCGARPGRQVREPGVSHQLRLHVVGAAVVGAERAIRPTPGSSAPRRRSCPCSRRAGCPCRARGAGMPARRVRARERIRAGDERLAAPEQRVADAQVRAGLRVAVGLVAEVLPVEEVLARQPTKCRSPATGR